MMMNGIRQAAGSIGTILCAAFVLGVGPTRVAAQILDLSTCYAVGASTSPDTLVSINKDTGVETSIGSTGVDGIESLAFPANGSTLYAATNDTLGTIDTTTGAFTGIGTFGTTTNPTAITLNDIRSIAWDSEQSQTGVLYGVHHRASPSDDILFVIDRNTGAFIADAFGVGFDYVPITGAAPECQADIEDIAFEPTFPNRLYGISNTNEVGDALVTIALGGACSAVKNITNATGGAQIDNMGGLTFDKNGQNASGTPQLYGTTALPGTGAENRFWTISLDALTLGQATEVTALAAAADYESLACPNGACDNLRLNLTHRGTGLAGGKVTYQLTWVNNCIAQDFPNVVVTDVLPDGLQLLSASSRWGAVTTSGNTVTIDVGTVNPGQVAGLATIKAQITAGAGTITNSASLTDGLGGQVSASDVLAVRTSKRQLSLALRGQRKVRPGRSLSFVARYRNISATNTVTMTLPVELGLPTSIFPEPTLISGNVLTWQDVKPPSGMVRVTGQISSTTAAPNVLATTATAIDDTGHSAAASQTTTVSQAVTKQKQSTPTLSVTGPRFVRPGLVTQLTIRYRKINGSATVEVTLPAELSDVRFVFPQPTTSATGIFTFSALRGPSGTIKIKAAVSADATSGSGLAVTATLTDSLGVALQDTGTLTVR